MNELQPQWKASETLRSVFSTSDLLVVESLVRQVREVVESWVPSDSEIVALMLLAKATRLEHVALPLNQADLEDQLSRDLWADDNGLMPSAPAATEIIEVFANPTIWTGVLSEVVDIGCDLSRSGCPVVIATGEGVPRFAYLRRLAYAEDQVALELASSVEGVSDALKERGFTFEALVEALPMSSPELKISEAVTHAVKNLVTRRISVLTGGPGTGKTFTVAALLGALHQVSIHNEQMLKVARCAPTAKAAVRMGEEIEKIFSFLPTNETFGITFDSRSGSVQRLLKMHQNSSTANRELDVDLLIVDEVSMLDLGLLEQLLGAVQPHTHVLLVGDPNQLISVRVGAILRDIVELAEESGPTRSIVTELTVAHRFGAAINELARAINNGDIAAVKDAFENYPENLALAPSSESLSVQVLEWAKKLVNAARNGDEALGIATLRKLSVLCGTRMGSGSVAWWTKKIQMALVSEGLLSPEQRIPIGAPVMVTKNELRTAFSDGDVLSNGDVGLAMETPTGTQVVFGPIDRPRTRRANEVEHFEFGWSLTIHKSQGSDYDEVIVSLPSKGSSFVSRELLYTAVTRAKEKVSVIGTLENIDEAIKVRANRVGGLKLRLALKTQQD